MRESRQHARPASDDHPAGQGGSLNRRLIILLGVLYFAQGLPFGLLTKSLPAIAREAGVPTRFIGLLALAALPWALKFLWSPWVDRWGRGRPDHRKRWVIASQLVAVGLLVLLGALPNLWLFRDGLWLMLALLFLLNLCFATHDIASDGLAVRMLPPNLRGLGNSLQTGGYKAGLMIGGAAMLVGLDWLGWRLTLWTFAVLLVLLLVPVWRYRESAEVVENAGSGGERISWRWWRDQLLSFWLRPGMGLWLLLLLGYKLGDSFGSRMIKPMLVDHQWTLTQIGMLELISSLIGLLGAVLAGFLLLRFARIWALVLFGLMQALGLLGWGLIDVGDTASVWMVSLFEQLADGLSTVALFTMMMDRCRMRHEGTDYTMQACLVLSISGVATLMSGYSAEWFGYSDHFQLSAALALAAILPAIFWKRAVHD